MKGVNDCSTAELELKKTNIGRPGRRVTRDNFWRILRDVERYSENNALSLDYDIRESLKKMSRLCVDQTSKGALFDTLRKIEHSTNTVRLYSKKIENVTCGENEDLGNNYLYKLYNDRIVDARSRIETYRADLSDALNHEIGLLQKTVNQIDKNDWNKILAGRRQRFSKLLNEKSKMDIDSSIFSSMKEEKERHGLSWDQYMAALLSLSGIEKNKIITKLTDDDDSSFEDVISAKWL